MSISNLSTELLKKKEIKKIPLMATYKQQCTEEFYGKEEEEQEQEYTEIGESDTESYDSDDSQEDPTFDILQKAEAKFSKLSIKKKSKARIAKDMDMSCGVDIDEAEIVVPALDEEDEKSFEKVQKMIEEKLKVDQCKVYLRKNGLRLTGNKDTLIQRIKDHQEILNGGGEKKYPVSSFVLNCKGDACTGDIVMFEQNVYEMFNIASRSASGPLGGTRMVAGRIVKESYGAAKQQHTFTRWEDEGERQKALMEKHSRGSVARSRRETRIEEKEMRKLLKGTR
ncbi:hypothetical protein L1049_004275 [Liquidambar formosana]|uniref:SAP domain-containing protein n=1 Tax=Liquidambar formosana TaxID=63359 RepID=A0AAP0RT20_LIQFO